MITTKSREPQFALLDEPPGDQLPEVVDLSPEQAATFAEAEERDRQRRQEWAAINRALTNNTMPVTRAIARWHAEEDGVLSHVERVLSEVSEGSFLVNRLGAAGVVDQDLAIVLLDLRKRLVADYGHGPAAAMLIDRAAGAYQDFLRVSGWVGNLSLLIEHEFFGLKGPNANFEDRYGREGRTIRGLTVEQHLAHLREELLPLADRCGRTLTEALAALERLRGGPSEMVERSSPLALSISWPRRAAEL